ncbi:MAG: TonB-dependent receptor [Bacteroidota bacterium]
MARQILETDQKALEINLNQNIYGTFSEIGAGQEVARYFFQVGAAAGTIAKTMSAYDKIFSDKIYGVEASGRYVCESRLYKMLNHEFELLQGRLRIERPNATFFAFADTVAAINYSRTIKGNGWLGLRFQLHPDSGFNELVLHTKMLDKNNQLQQQAIGILGVNMIYACYHYQNEPDILVQSLLDNLEGRVKIDMIRLKGEDFEAVDNRLLCLKLVEYNLTDVAMFGPDGSSMHPSEFLYRKHVMVVRGSFRPPTLVNQDMIRKSFDQFRQTSSVDAKKAIVLTEITLDNLRSEGAIDEKDYLDRAELLCELGQTVIISKSEDHHHLIRYLADYKVPSLGVVIGARQLLELMNDKYYQHENGDLLGVFGQLFKRHVCFYVYPAMQEGSEELMTAQQLPIPEGVKFLYKHLLDNQQIVNVGQYDPNILHIFSAQVLQMINDDDDQWENMVSRKIADAIKEQSLFGYPKEKREFDY